MGVFGTVQVELTSADLFYELQALGELGVRLRDVQPLSELTARLSVDRAGWKALNKLKARRGFTLKILSRRGILWPLMGLRRRPVLVISMAVFLLAALYLPTRVLFVRVEGNAQVPTRAILEQAAQSGIGFWSSRREVRSEKMKNALLGRLPQLQWAGVNTYGCVAVISVREREPEETAAPKGEVSSLVAARDGVILSCTVTAGNGLCKPGQAVTAGEMLICGYTDHGLSVTGQRAEGEILARTKRELTVVTPDSWQVREETGQQETKYSIQFGKFRINFFKGSGIYGGSCVKMYSKYVLTLPGGFTLPVTVLKQTVQYCETAQAPVEEQAAEELSDFAVQYLKSRMIGGSILARQEQVSAEDGLLRLEGIYDCTEQIGQRRQEETGENHETD